MGGLKRLPPVFCLVLIFLASVLPVEAQVTSNTADTEVVAEILPPAEFSIRIVPDKLGEAQPGEVVTYTVFYQNGGDLSIPLSTLRLSWGFQTDEVASYVLGSAQDAYGGSLPTVDFINQAISWSITNLPAGAGVQQTSFQLQVNETHPYLGTYFFYVDGQIVVSEAVVASADQVLNSVTYVESKPPVIPPVAVTGLIITDVRILEVTAHHALIYWQTNLDSDGLVRYGLSKAYGLEKDSRNQPAQEHVASLDELDPETVYHFQIAARSDKTEVVSEDYMFKTAGVGVKIPTLDVGSLLFRAYNLRLHPDSAGLLAMYPEVDLGVELPVYGEGLSVELDLGGRILSLFPQEPPWFSGGFPSPEGVGEYPILAKVIDRVGNYITTDLTILAVVARPQITDSTHRPVKGAVVTLYRYNPFIKRFAPFDISQFDQDNPWRVSGDGRFGWVVPYGRYELRAEAPGFMAYRSSEMVMLRNGVLREEIVLTRVPVGWLGQIWYWIKRLVFSLVIFFTDLWQSLLDARLVEHLAVPLLLLTTLAVFLEFLTRTGLSLFGLLKFLLFLILPKKAKPWGEVRDTANGQPVYLVNVELFSHDGHRLDWTFSNRRGEFGFDRPREEYFLKLAKRGFETPEWQFAGDAPDPSLRRAIRIDVQDEKAWIQVWVNRSLKVRGRPGLSQGVKITEGLLLNLASFAIILGLIAAIINVINHPLLFSWAVLVLYLILSFFWILLLWLR